MGHSGPGFQITTPGQQIKENVCTTCGGSGEITCPQCEGTGKIPDDEAGSDEI
jgi:DnaJ-class molecular chaperone